MLNNAVEAELNVKPKVLLIDRDVERRAKNCEFLSETSECMIADNMSDAEGMVNKCKPEVVVIDAEFGVDAALNLSHRGCSVYISGNSLELETVRTAARYGIGVVRYPLRSVPEGRHDIPNRKFDIRNVDIPDWAKPAKNAEVFFPRPGNDTIVFMSPKGGVGKTLLAVNFAAFVKKSTGRSVCLVDTDWPFGDVAPMLQISPAKTILDFSYAPDNVGEKILRNMMTVHEGTGLSVLPTPVAAGDKADLSPWTVIKAVRNLQRYYDLVVIDTGPNFNDLTKTVLPLATKIVMIVTHDIPTINECYRLTEMLKRNKDIDIGAIHILINASNKRTGINDSDIEELLPFKMVASVPFDQNAQYLVNKGEIPILNKKSSLFEKAIRQAAENLIPGIKPKKSLLARLLGRAGA